MVSKTGTQEEGNGHTTGDTNLASQTRLQTKAYGGPAHLLQLLAKASENSGPSLSTPELDPDLRKTPVCIAIQHADSQTCEDLVSDARKPLTWHEHCKAKADCGLLGFR